MDWLEFILSALGGSVITGVGSIIYFRPKLKEAKAAASKAETEASAAEYTHLLERINTMEELYKKQGEELDELRGKFLALGREKLASDETIMRIESENKILQGRVDKLTEEIKAYKTLINKQ